METLETDRLILRAWKPSDYKDLHEYATSPLVGPNAGWKPHANEDESKRIVMMFMEHEVIYAMEYKENGKVIGGIGLHERQPDETLKHLAQRELGFVLSPDYWGKGLIPEAVNRLIEYGFEELKLDLIWCGHYRDNTNSKRVSEKCGFTCRFKRTEVAKLLDNKEVEIHYYNMFKEEYLNKNK